MLKSPNDTLTGHLGLLGSILGLIGGLALMPTDTQPAGALTRCAIVLAIGLLSGTIYDVAVRGVGRAVRAEHLIIFAVIYFVLLDLIQGLYPLSLTQQAVRSSFFMVALFGAACAVGSMLKPLPLPGFVMDCALRKYSSNSMFRLILLCFVVGMFNFAYFSHFSPAAMITGLREPRWAAPWNRESLGGWNSFGDFLTYVGYMVPTLTIMTGIQRRSWIHWHVLCGFLFSGIFLAFVSQSGGRRIIGAITASAVVTWVCARRSKLRAVHVGVLLCVAVVTILFLDALLVNRNRGYGQFSYNLAELRGIRVDDNFLRMGQLAEIIPREYSYVGFRWLTYVLVRPVPRVLWPGKPIDPGFSLTDYLRQKGVTYSSSVIGEWYMAFGWYGVIFGGMALGYGARMWSQLLDENLPVTGIGLYGLGLMSMIIGVRSLIEVVLMSYPLICWLLINKLIPKPSPKTELRMQRVYNVA
jgi:hypothetical protein